MIYTDKLDIDPSRFGQLSELLDEYYDTRSHYEEFIARADWVTWCPGTARNAFNAVYNKVLELYAFMSQNSPQDATDDDTGVSVQDTQKEGQD